MKRALVPIAYVAVCLLLFEAVSRGYWSIAHGTPFLGSPARVAHEVLYPELRAAASEAAGDPAGPRVLLLGASALHPEFGNVEARLRAALGPSARIVNLAVPAQSSRDSYLKYRFLEDERFDLVIVYHGINEVRANNCPPEMFREDYSHYAWYERANRLEGSPALWSVLSFTLAYLADEAKRRWLADAYVPEHRPEERWLDFGSEIKTAPSFARNLEGILRIAERRGDAVLLMTFANYLAPGYSEEAMDEARLDYTDSNYSYPVETWGKPENVVAGIRAHNQVVRALAKAHPEVGFVDQERAMPGGRRNFVDICHLTKPGSRRFVRNALPEIRRALGAGPSAGANAGERPVHAEPPPVAAGAP